MCNYAHAYSLRIEDFNLEEFNSLTLGIRNSPGNSTSAVFKLKLLKKRHFSSIKKDLRNNAQIYNP